MVKREEMEYKCYKKPTMSMVMIDLDGKSREAEEKQTSTSPQYHKCRESAALLCERGSRRKRRKLKITFAKGG